MYIEHNSPFSRIHLIMMLLQDFVGEAMPVRVSKRTQLPQHSNCSEKQIRQVRKAARAAIPLPIPILGPVKPQLQERQGSSTLLSPSPRPAGSP